MRYTLHVLILYFLVFESGTHEASSPINTQTNQHRHRQYVTRKFEPGLVNPQSYHGTNQLLDPSLRDATINNQHSTIHSFSKFADKTSTTGQTRTTKRVWNERQHNASNYESRKTGTMIDKTNCTEIHLAHSRHTHLHSIEEEPPSFGRFTLEDNFLCLPCDCYMIQPNGSVVATCSGQYSIADIKSALRNDTVNVTIVNSKISVFLGQDFDSLSVLKSLTVSGNKHLREVKNSSIISDMPVSHLDLSHNQIQTIFDRSFKAMPHLLTLDLSSNSIKRIGRFSLQGLHVLQYLSVSNNRIQILGNGSFDELFNLRTLDLSRNKGLGYETRLSPDAFKGVDSLYQFYFEGNYISGCTYPNELIAEFRNLSELSIDLIGQDINLNPEMQFLKNLTSLNASCRNGEPSALRNVSETFLENVPYLHTVRFNKCPIQNVDPNVYRYVNNLTTLQFSYTYPYSIFRALEGLQTLHNSSLTSLSLIGLIPSSCPFIILAERHCQFLSQLLLEELDMSENRIGFIEEGFIQGLPLTLRKLTLRENKLVEPRLLLSKLYFLERLETLDLASYLLDDSTNLMDDSLGYTGGNQDISRQDGNTNTASCYSAYQLRQAALCRQQLSNFSVLCLDQKYDFNSCNNYVDLPSVCDRHLLQRDVSISKTDDPMPPNLRYLLANRFLEMNISGVFDIIRAAANNTLKEVDISYCALPKFPGSRITIPHNIHAANFEGNYFHKLPHHLFEYNNLSYLNLANNVLGNQFAQNNTTLLHGLKHLVYLNISMNMIFELSSNFFSGLNRLKYLIMNRNKLHVVNTNFSNMPNLQYLDLNKNSVGWINKPSRDDLDMIRTLHPLYIDISDNPLRCTCEGLDVLIWIQTSNIHFLSMDFLKCHRDDGSPEFVGDLNDQVMSLRRRCLGNAVIAVLSAALVLLVSVVIVFGLMYRYRWQLRYIRNIAFSRLFGFKPRESASSAYKFDAFIVYSDMSRQFVVGDCLQELEVKRGHKLCVDGRDFMPGTYEVSAIVSAIQNSRKTVLILSPDFYDEQFSEYCVKMAIMEEIYKKRSVLYLCVYRPLPDDEMSKSYDLLMIMKRNNYLELPPKTEISEEVRHNFWDQFSEIIGHSAITDMAHEVELTEIR